MKIQNMAGTSPEATTYRYIRNELLTHLDKAGAPEEVRSFLLDHWARLMTGIFIAKGNQHADWHAGWETINALLWSLSSKNSRGECMRLLRILPTLLARLHEGCAALGIDLQARDALFSNMAMLHAAIIREGLHLRANEALPEVSASLDGDEPLPAGEIKSLQPADDVEPARGGSESSLPPDLKIGDWVRFSLPKGHKRLRLTWLSPQQGMYLFANEHGMDSMSLTRARLLAKFQAGDASLERPG